MHYDLPRVTIYIERDFIMLTLDEIRHQFYTTRYELDVCAASVKSVAAKTKRDKQSVMIWYYFEIKEGGVSLVSDDYFGTRPLDASDDKGNPHTPWYQLEDHWDEKHIHIRAVSDEQALVKAMVIFESEF